MGFRQILLEESRDLESVFEELGACLVPRGKLLILGKGGGL